jgi:hypothetical protein
MSDVGKDTGPQRKELWWRAGKPLILAAEGVAANPRCRPTGQTIDFGAVYYTLVHITFNTNLDALDSIGLDHAL